jgi:nitrous oxidase accessory protein
MGIMKVILYIVLICIFCEYSASRIINIQNLDKVDLKKVIENSNPYDSIVINTGKFRGESITIDKALSIIGTNYPIIEGLGKDHIFKFKSDSIFFEGIKVINSGYSYVQDRAAIRLDSSDNCTIKDCKFDNCMFAIYASGIKNLKIQGNELQGSKKGESASGNGVHLWYSKNVFVSNNTITGHRDGIYLEFTQNVIVNNNYCYKNMRYGLHFMFSHNAEYRSNVFRRNGSGVAVMYTYNVLMENNIFDNNKGSSAYGLLLKDIKNSKIVNNKFTNNSTGIYIEGGGKNLIKKNLIKNNAWALRLLASSSDNNIESNNIIGNSFDVTSNSSISSNKFSGNYWDKYNGYDYNKDGIGDVPYYPVRLFAYLVEKNPPLIILLHSFFVFVLDLAENVIPTIVPDSIIDNSPMMIQLK